MPTDYPLTYRIRHRARKLRYERSQKLNRQVTIREVATAIGVEESKLSRFEAQARTTLDLDILQRLVA